MMTMTGILISGGGGYNDPETGVEVFFPSSGQSCSLSSLPDDRYEHTMDTLLICGGGNNDNNCLTFTSGEWMISHTLVGRRLAHTSWQTEQGVLLLGGLYGTDTTEIVHLAGEQAEQSFGLHYNIS